MTKFYFIKSFAKNIKIILLLLSFLFTATYSYSDAYRVENVIIQESFQNIKNFRQNLINRGIISSFQTLSKRILLEFFRIKPFKFILAQFFLIHTFLTNILLLRFQKNQLHQL